MAIQDVFTRRNFIAAAGGTLVVGMASPADAATATHVLWMLDSDWGTPLVTTTGATKSRCRAAACHNAAPHRLFFTAADAIAGRLHTGCLAQPAAVNLCVDLNMLMPFYGARKGGIDGRCPDLPPALRSALYQATACAAPAPPVQAPSPPPVLPRTGDDSSMLAIAAATTAIGAVAWAATSRDKAVKNSRLARH